MAFDEHGYICPYNENCRCQIADCEYCGWNPIVAEKRLEEICENLGVQKEKTQYRCIDAIDLVIKMGGRLEPLVRKSISPRTIYNAAMKCIAAAPTLKLDITTCEQCQFAKHIEETNTWKCGNRKGLSREVNPTEYCAKGKRRVTDDE